MTSRHGHRPQRARVRAARAQAVRHARHPRRPPRPGPRRGTRPPGLPPGPVPGRDLPPRVHVPGPPHPPRPLRDRGHPGGVRLRRLPEAARRPDPRPRRPPLAGKRASPSSSTARSASARATSPRPSPTSPSAPGPRPGSSRPAASSPTSPAGRADRTWDKRLAELTRPAVLVLDDFGMRELTAPQADDLYELITERAGKVTDPDIQPGARRLVPAVPQPRRRRIAAGPAHQHQPPVLHERAELPAEQGPGRVVPTGNTSAS